MLVKQFLNHLKAGQKSAATVKQRRYYLRRAERSLELETASTSELEAWLAYHSWGQETARSARSSLVVFYAWLQDSGYRADNPAAKLPRISEKTPLPKPLPEVYYHEGLRRAGAVEHLAMRLAGEAGLRRNEVAQIHSRDLAPDLLGFSLLVHGKGGKERLVPLSDSLYRGLARACQDGGWAFPSPVTDSHLTAGNIGKRVGDLLPAGYSMHSLRHRFATTAYTVTNDIRAVQELLGHATLNTTQRYVAVTSQRLRTVALAAAA